MQKKKVLHLFNPDNDLALANGSNYYTPPRSARQMAEDLALLPAWWAMPGDYVMIPHVEALHDWSTLSSEGLPRPDIEAVTPSNKVPEKVEIRPWGWNPSLVRRLAMHHLSDDCLPDAERMQTWRQLSSRQTAVETLPHLIDTLGGAHRLTGESSSCHTMQEVEKCLTRWPRCMLKSPWSCSGKGLRRAEGALSEPTRGWCRRTLVQQGCVVAEPLYNKVSDFALEFHASESGVSYVCSSEFFTDANGAYSGNALLPEEESLQQVHSLIGRTTLAEVREALSHHLGRLAEETNYRGFIGVDMMVCQLPDGGYSLHPCVEINWRMSMGVVAHLVNRRYVAEGRRGRYLVEYFPTTEALASEHQRRMAVHPVRLTSDGKRLLQGYQPLTPIGQETHYLASILVE